MTNNGNVIEPEEEAPAWVVAPAPKDNPKDVRGVCDDDDSDNIDYKVFYR
jgi:hypothetical protein